MVECQGNEYGQGDDEHVDTQPGEDHQPEPLPCGLESDGEEADGEDDHAEECHEDGHGFFQSVT